ncbi:MAG: metallophosphoesterase [Phycisphaerales bacterium]|nr:MAG: metallophosphoesterase [Phycisphaerales bacterium]
MKLHSKKRPHAEQGITRRAFLGGCIAGPITASALGTAYALGIEPTWVEVTRLGMPLRGLGSALAGYRLVQISDLHCGSAVPVSYLADCMAMVNRLAPDLVVLTGDVLTRGQWDHLEKAADLLSRLDARDGLVAILGNHDHGMVTPTRGLVDSWGANRITDTIRALGHTVLRNDSTRITRGDAGLRIVGLDDYWARRFDIPAAFRDVDGHDPVVALTHNPDTFIDLARTQAQWILAGHTHGGQVRLPLLGPPALPIRNKALAAGLIEMNGRRFYVNRGLGWLHRVRFNVRPEITLFELAPA